jgi:hypothetical protein
VLIGLIATCGRAATNPLGVPPATAKPAAPATAAGTVFRNLRRDSLATISSP